MMLSVEGIRSPSKRSFRAVLTLLCFACLCFSATTWAGVTGKIAGVVIDADGKVPIEGATIRVVGTGIATETDADGEYFVINVPGGKYDIAVTVVGYESVITRDVRVLVDLTTPLDFTLVQEAVQLGEKVVYAENPIIQKDLTSSKIIFTSDRLKTLPNITTVQSVLTNYPGVILDRDQALHVRGGRAGQISYYYDGFSVQDPFYATSGIHIVPNALEELTLTSGGYAAEYGEALSGVVSAVSREGTGNYRGSIKAYQGFTHAYDVNTGDWSGLKSVGNYATAMNLSGPVPLVGSEVHTFSVAGEYRHDPTDLPHNGRTAWTVTGKLSLQPLRKMKVVSNGTYFESEGQLYTHRDVNGVSYDFNLDGLPFFKKRSYLFGFSSNYHFNDNMVATTRYNRFYTFTKSAPEHLFDTYWSDWPGYSEDSTDTYNGTIDDDNYLNDVDWSDPMQVVGFTIGDDYQPTFRRRESSYDAFHLSLISQLGSSNELKAGWEYRKYRVEWDFKQFYNTRPYGENYSSQPDYMSLFLQDKLEYDYFVINMGLRYDYRNADVSYTAWTVNEDGDGVPYRKDADSRWELSPRFGVSYPISEKSVMHLNYGVYYQVPRFTYLYTNMDGDISSGYPIVGNPDLQPEQTTSYEIGLDHLVGESFRFDITAYYKDIKDLVTTRSSFKVAGNSVTFFVNDDYGSAKGLDISLEKLASGGFVSGSVSYGYMIAKGVGSWALEPYYTYLTSTEDTLAPVNEYPLDFDQRHTVTAVVDFRVPHDRKLEVAGVAVPGGWGLNVVGHYGSGLPYTLTDVDGNRLGERNEGRLPAYYTVDMRFNKDFRFARGQYVLSLFVEADNVFDRRNIIDVYSLTGRPDYDGSIPTATLALSAEDLQKYDALYDHDPQNFSPPRTVRAGLEFSF
ncbi:MAG: TonB-dependent receptor [Candidatus Zixiibacteriota bacterium]|nr:MAG: TonB-dependent receptor [candidate division Zixibacteria bacterium]